MLFKTTDRAGFVSVHETPDKEIAIQAHLIHYGIFHCGIEKVELVTEIENDICHAPDCDEYIELLEYEDDKIKCKSIEEVINKIDKIDEEIVKLLSKRIKYIKQTAINDILIQDINTKVKDHALGYGLDPEIIEKIYQAINETMTR